MVRGEDLSRNKSGSYRSESSNSWHDYTSPREDDTPTHKISDNFERGEGGLYLLNICISIALIKIELLVSVLFLFRSRIKKEKNQQQYFIREGKH